MEKIISEMETIWSELDNNNSHKIDTESLKGRPRFNGKLLLGMKVFLLTGYVFVLVWLLQNGSVCLNSVKYCILFFISVLLVLVSIYWYVFFIARINQVKISEDNVKDFEIKKKMLLLMEKYEFIVSIFGALPCYLLVFMPVIKYIKSGYDVYSFFLTACLHRMPLISATFIIGILYYIINKNIIKRLSYETNNRYKLITLKITKSWQELQTLPL